MHSEITKIIACKVVVEEMSSLVLEGVDCETLELGLHINPDNLRKTLQERIDASENGKGTILLGYGLCSRTVVGLRSRSCSLVIPRVDDCRSIFLGSQEAYLDQAKSEPGTYYLTKGWIEGGDNAFSPNPQMFERYSPEQIERLTKLMLKNYTRLVFINTGKYDVEQYREYSKRMASRYDLRFEEIHGNARLVDKMIKGPWDKEFIVVPPGQEITYEAFYGSPG